MSVTQGTGAGHVGADEVALDGDRVVANELDAIGLVAGDDVARGDGRAADGYLAGTPDEDPRDAIGHLGGAGGVGADEVALDCGADNTAQCDAIAAIARDDIARPRGGAADREVAENLGAVEIGLDAVGAVGQGGGAGGVDADIVALHDDGRAAHQKHAVALVPGNNVAGVGGGAADGEAGRRHGDDAILVGNCRSAGGISTDLVAGYQNAAAAADVDARGRVSGDGVADAGNGAAHAHTYGIEDIDARGLIGHGGGAGGVGADEIAPD